MRENSIIPAETREAFEIVFLFGDRHAIHHSPVNDRIIVESIRLLQPDIIIDGGDPINATCLTRKFKRKHSQLLGIKDEIIEDRTFRRRIDEVSPSSRKIMLEDNHLVRRLDDIICDSNWWIDELDQMKPENILPLSELGWTLKDEFTWKKTLLAAHGDVPRLRGSADCPVNKCRQIVSKSGMTIIKFHSHATGFEMIPSTHGIRYACQLGTVMDTRKVEYEKHHDLSMATESVGIAYLSRKNTDHFVLPVPIYNGTAVINGTVIDGDIRRSGRPRNGSS